MASSEKWFKPSVIGFYVGTILMYLVLLPFMPATDPAGDITVRQISTIMGVIYLIASLGIVLMISAWIHRKNKSKVLMLLIPGILIFSLAFLSVFGGVIVG